MCQNQIISIDPLITLIQGRIRLEGLARTKSNAIERMIRWLESNLPRGEVALATFHTDALQEAVAISERLESALDASESFITEMTPVIGAHTGPGLVGAAWWMHPINTK